MVRDIARGAPARSGGSGSSGSSDRVRPEANSARHTNWRSLHSTCVASQARRDASGGRGRPPRSGVRGADEPGAGADVCYFDGDGCVGGRARARCRSGAAGTSDGAMWSGLSAGRIWLCTEPTDMRCARAPAERLSVRWPAQYRRRRRRRRSRPKAAPVAASRRTRRPNPGTQRRTAGFTSWIQIPGSVARLRRRTCTTYPGKRETRGDDELLCLATDPHSPVATAAKCL